MIRLHPIPEVGADCPGCKKHLRVDGWWIPGIRVLAKLGCDECGRRFYGDLPVGHAMFRPLLLEPDNATIHGALGDDYHWFERGLITSFEHRNAVPLTLKEERFAPIRRPLLLNTLDTHYGHSLLKLLNAQYYLDHRSDLDLWIVVQPALRWLVPDGVAEVWTVDVPFKRAEAFWSDELANRLLARFGDNPAGFVSRAVSHPNPGDFDIERFSRTEPFDVDGLEDPIETPVLTLIWREDRLWTGTLAGRAAPVKAWRRRLRRLLGTRQPPTRSPVDEQVALVTRFLRRLASVEPSLELNVIGFGNSGRLPDHVRDLRRVTIDAAEEKAWCEHFARSHVVIGVHGSNMLLPSAHAALTIDLMPVNRWGNLAQDYLVPRIDPVDALLRFRSIPVTTTPEEAADICVQAIRRLPASRKVASVHINSHGDRPATPS